jgi:hypothetical protein
MVWARDVGGWSSTTYDVSSNGVPPDDLLLIPFATNIAAKIVSIKVLAEGNLVVGEAMEKFSTRDCLPFAL